VQHARAHVHEVVEAVGMPERPLGEDEAGRQALGLGRLENRGHRIGHGHLRIRVRSYIPTFASGARFAQTVALRSAEGRARRNVVMLDLTPGGGWDMKTSMRTI